MEKRKTSAGFTLMEAVIALGIWMIISVSVILIWQYTADRTNALLARQSAFENARGAMDILLVNIEMAKSIQLTVGRDYVLRNLTLPSYDAGGAPNDFEFDFDITLPPTAPRFRWLRFGNTELASNIAMVRVQPIGGQIAARPGSNFPVVFEGMGERMHVTVITGCEFPIILEGSVDIRYKELTINQW